jgi:hypothetical protein
VRGRHLTTAVTLIVLVAILLLGGYYGAKSLFAPLPGDKPSASSSAGCKNTDVKKGQKIRARQVQVSVFNAGTRAGLAEQTQDKLHKRGFQRGEVGNAPSDAEVKRAQVWTTRRHDAAARLVAKQLGSGAPVKFVDRNLGPGVDVVVGNNFHHLAQVKSFIVVKRAGSACVSK